MKNEFKDKKILILGAGISGEGAQNALMGLGAKCVVIDEKIGEVESLGEFDMVVVSPSIVKEHKIFKLANELNIPIIGEIELGYRLFKGQIVAVTGTNGKTTTVALIGQMLEKDNKKVSVCGNIGVSFSKVAITEVSDFASLEVSSFQLESIVDFHAHIACITNISEDHLDRHRTMSEYIAQKLKIANNQTEEDFLILSQDDIPLYALKNFYPKAQVLYTSVRGKVKGAYLLNDKIYYKDEFICSRSSVKIQGDYNLSNALMAIAACKQLDVQNEAIIETLSSFTSDKHRCVLVDTIGGKSYYNDSKGTNIGATIKACEAMPSDTCLILGGSDKGYEFDKLFEKLPLTIKNIFVIGDVSNKVLKAAWRNNFYEIEQKNTLQECVKEASLLDVKNVLLSPATASFDMFKDYKDRGEQFEKAVNELNDNKDIN